MSLKPKLSASLLSPTSLILYISGDALVLYIVYRAARGRSRAEKSASIKIAATISVSKALK